MPEYQYKAIGTDGIERKGTVMAVSEEQAREKCKNDGLLVASLTENVLQRRVIVFRSSDKVKPNDYCVFCNQFVSIHSAGVSTVNTLQMLCEQTENKYLRKSVACLIDDIKSGESLAAAMQKQGNVFPQMLVNAVEAGEDAGTLDASFLSMAVQFEKETGLRKVIRQTRTYPFYVFCVALAVIFAMLAFVIPSFLAMFADMNIDMPAFTRCVNLVSCFFADYWWAVVSGFFLLTVILKLWSNTLSGRRFFSHCIMYTPFYGKLQTRIESARLARALSAQLHAGIAMPQALEMVAETLHDNVLFEQAVLTASKQTQAGVALSKPLQTCGLFPPMLIHMVSIGEETGNLVPLLEEAADYFENETEDIAGRMTAVIEPAIILLMAVISGVLIMAIMQPMLTLYDAVSNM